MIASDVPTYWCVQAAVQQAAEIGSQRAMHAAGMRPLYLDRQAIPQEALAHERQILSVQVGRLPR